MPAQTEVPPEGLLEGLVTALSDKQGQVDVRLEGVTLSMGDSRLAVHLSGALTISVHLRELTDAEKDAHASATVARVHA